jgi:tungstate transport system substrate-binding protein
MKDKIKLNILFETDQTYLFNPYHVMAVNPAKFPDVKYDLHEVYRLCDTAGQALSKAAKITWRRAFVPAASIRSNERPILVAGNCQCC